MNPRRCLLALLPLPALLGACASLGGDPPRVSLVDLRTLPGQGLEWRAMARLRVQNPRAAELRFEGVSVELALRGLPFASGVAPVAAVLAPFSETVLEVPISVSGLAVLRQLLDGLRELSRKPDGTPARPTLPYALSGRLGGFGGHRFESTGTVELPELVAPRPPASPPATAAP